MPHKIPAKLDEMIKSGLFRLDQIRAEKLAAEHSAQAAHKLEVDQAWIDLQKGIFHLLPNFLHPFINFDEDYDRRPDISGSVWLIIQDFAPIEVNYTLNENDDWIFQNIPYRIPSPGEGHYNSSILAHEPVWDSKGYSMSETDDLELALAIAYERGEKFKAAQAEYNAKEQAYLQEQKAREERIATNPIPPPPKSKFEILENMLNTASEFTDIGHPELANTAYSQVAATSLYLIAKALDQIAKSRVEY